ncbi:MAG: hypothetical protein AB7P04_13975, partial [Bacteriovoracia bacterium]
LLLNPQRCANSLRSLDPASEGGGPPVYRPASIQIGNEYIGVPQSGPSVLALVQASPQLPLAGLGQNLGSLATEDLQLIVRGAPVPAPGNQFQVPLELVLKTRPTGRASGVSELRRSFLFTATTPGGSGSQLITQCSAGSSDGGGTGSQNLRITSRQLINGQIVNLCMCRWEVTFPQAYPVPPAVITAASGVNSGVYHVRDVNGVLAPQPWTASQSYVSQITTTGFTAYAKVPEAYPGGCVFISGASLDPGRGDVCPTLGYTAFGNEFPTNHGPIPSVVDVLNTPPTNVAGGAPFTPPDLPVPAALAPLAATVPNPALANP